MEPYVFWIAYGLFCVQRMVSGQTTSISVQVGSGSNCCTTDPYNKSTELPAQAEAVFSLTWTTQKITDVNKLNGTDTEMENPPDDASLERITALRSRDLAESATHQSGEDEMTVGSEGLTAVTTAHLLSGLELMEYLFEIGFQRDVMDKACYDKLREYGYYDRLSFYAKFCLCRLLCIKPFVHHELDEIDQQRVISARKDNTERVKEVKFDEQLDLTVGITVFNSILLLVGLTGNALVLITVSRFVRKPSVTYIFLCSIACSDLLVNVICLPLQIYRRLSGDSTNIYFCRVINFLFYLSLGCSIFSLLATSTERYLVICHPMKAQSVSTTSRAKKIVLVVWLISAVSSTPFTYYTTSRNMCSVSFPDHTLFTVSGAVFFVLYYLLPVSFMVFAYTSVSVSLWRSIKMSKALQSKRNDSNNKAKEAAERIAVIRMLILVLFMFITCWTPYWWYYSSKAFGILDKFFPDSFVMYERIVLEYAVLMVAMANSSINPILYAFASGPLRRALIRCFLTCCGKASRAALMEESSSRLTASTRVSAPVSSSATA